MEPLYSVQERSSFSGWWSGWSPWMPLKRCPSVVCGNSCITTKQHVPHQSLTDLCLGSEVNEVEEHAICSHEKVDSLGCTAKGMLQENSKEYPEEWWSKKTALLYAVADAKWFGGTAIEMHCFLHVVWKALFMLCSFGGQPVFGRILKRLSQLTRSNTLSLLSMRII